MPFAMIEMKSELQTSQLSNHMMKLASCRTTYKQIFVGIKTDGSRFELSPKGSTDMCLVNLEHHPKAQEIIYATSCKLVRTIHTNEWTAYNEGSSGSSTSTGSGNTNLKLRNPECSDNSLCDICEGDCDSDDQCRSYLLCFKRTGNEPVPGCFGTGTVGRDYCYKLPSPVPSIGKNVFEKLRAPGCSRDRPCLMCNGDCDNDDECAGNLVCKQKDGPGYVQSCSGYDHSRTDFCVPAST